MEKKTISRAEISKRKTFICQKIKDLSYEDKRDVAQFFANCGRLNELHEGNGTLTIDLDKLKEQPTDDKFEEIAYSNGENNSAENFIVRLYDLINHKIDNK